MIYCFSDCLLDEERRELRRGAEVIAIAPKVFQVLVYLIRHCDRAVTRHELMEQCWPDTVVGDEALTRCLGRVRKAVGDDRTASPIIKTLPGHGYRFVAILETHADDATTAQGPAAPRIPAVTEGLPVSSHLPEVSGSGRLTSASFVGRAEELRELRVALTETLAGTGRLVLLGGPPGIGKTRTAQEVAMFAAEAGADVFWGRCYEGQGAPPYWPWVQIIRSYIAQSTADQTRMTMGEGASDIAEIVPDVHAVFPDLPPPPPREPTQARFRLFDSIAVFLHRVSADRPRVVVLDNLHAADRASLLLLEFLAPGLIESRLFLVGTYRDVELTRHHPLFHTLGELARVPEVRRLLLRGLLSDDVRRFVVVTAGVEPPQRLVADLHTYTEGNPLFLTEVVRLLIHHGEVTPERMQDRTAWSFELPEGVRAVISRRLDMLSERCNQLLSVASVIGREFDLADLAHLETDSSEAHLLAGLEEAAAARIIEAVPGVLGRYRFTHALIQHTLITELTPEHRARLHAKLGAAIEASYGEGADVVQLAYHFERAVPVVGTAKLVQYALAAGEQALASYAYEEAGEHFKRALAVKERQPMDAETAALLFGLGRTQTAMAQYEEAVMSLSRAFDYYAERGDASQAATIATAPHFVVRQGVATALIQRALTLVPADSHHAGRLLSRYGRALGEQQGDYEAAAQAFERALAIARHEQDTGLEMQTLTSAASVDAFHLHWQRCLAKCLRAIDLANQIDAPHVEQDAHAWAMRCLCVMGDLEKAKQYGAANLRLVEKLRDRFWLGTGLWLNEAGSHLAGDWQTAQAFSDRCLTLLPADSRALSTRVVLAYQLGHVHEGATYLERLLAVLQSFVPGRTADFFYPAILTLPLISLMTGSTMRSDDIEQTATTLLTLPTTTPLVDMWARATLALSAVNKGNVEDARAQYTKLRAQQGTMLFGGTIGLSGDRLLGLLAATIEQRPQAEAHFEKALAFCQRAGYRPEYAWTCHDYAVFLLQDPAAGAPQKALTLVEEALELSTALGMQPLVKRLIARQQQVPIPSNPAPPYPDGLTKREAEVLGLIATGKTDREIAEALFISVHTVGNHVTNILTKTLAANRTEAAAYAARHGLA